MDLPSNIAPVWDNGHREGLQEGDKGRQRSIVQILPASNEPVEKILAYSGLAEAELEALMQQ